LFDEARNAYRFLGEPSEKGAHVRPIRRWKDNITIDDREIIVSMRFERGTNSESCPAVRV
jgi:hypothetical protein